MLQELSIKDFAIIEEVHVTFDHGLTVLTGETGAGKSIVIDAIGLLAGGRGSVEYVRHGSKKAEIEGLFIIENQKHQVYEIASYYGIEITDEMIVLSRTISSSGKSICRINGKLVTLAILREVGQTLIDIHSQHETQSLMNIETHIELLDTYAHNLIFKQKSEYQSLYNTYINLKKQLTSWSINEAELSHRLDLLKFQKKELEMAELQPDEDIVLEEKRHSLVNYEKIFTSVQTAYNALYGEQRGLEWLSIAQQTLEQDKNLDDFLEKSSEQMTNAYYMIEELSFDLRTFIDNLQFDEQTLNEIEARLDEINRLKKKYGTTVNDMLDYLAKIDEEIEQLQDRDTHLDHLEKQVHNAYQDALLEAKELHDLRKKASEALTKDIYQELKGLYLEKAQFKIAFAPDFSSNSFLPDAEAKIELYENGFDSIRFLISTNPGEPLKDLTRVASGGELSRIMLALKKIFASHQGVTSVIFDEVDTGVSGRVAQAIAEKIYEISNNSQVLCISHLPQVAAMSDSHKRIIKKLTEERTTTVVNELTKQEKVEELSRMMTGAEVTDSAIQHAKELYESAENYKKTV